MEKSNIHLTKVVSMLDELNIEELYSLKPVIERKITEYALNHRSQLQKDTDEYYEKVRPMVDEIYNRISSMMKYIKLKTVYRPIPRNRVDNEEYYYENNAVLQLNSSYQFYMDTIFPNDREIIQNALDAISIIDFPPAFDLGDNEKDALNLGECYSLVLYKNENGRLCIEKRKDLI